MEGKVMNKPLILLIVGLAVIVAAVLMVSCQESAEDPAAPGVSVDIDRSKPRPKGPSYKAPAKPRSGKR